MRRRFLQAIERTIDDEPGAGGDRRIAADLGLAVDRHQPHAQRPLDLGGHAAGDIVAVGNPDGKAGQRPFRLGKLQPPKAARVERHRGVGRRRVPGQRQHRAIGEVLLDLGRERAVELPQHNANARVGVAGAEGRLQVELIVAR